MEDRIVYRSPEELEAARSRHPLLLDVRTPEEWSRGAIPGSVNLPLGTLEAHMGQLAPYRGRQIFVICRSGARAAQAARLMRSMGFPHVAVLEGGMLAWQRRFG